ncbi:MAG: DegT/DnrJ/EryC1/StrS family aminotransferase [Armatimonadota bacterium]|nr:DegT/DnrJ/EryC1/StrS family aminotransferase [Armatimonadota bacterium]
MEKAKSRTFAPWPYFEEEEIEAAARVLRSGKVNYWTGEEGRLFEKEFAAFAGCEYAVAVANGSVALELALHALGIGEGDEVVVTSRTFVASASSIVLRGAKPVFADVDPDSQNITAETIRPVLTPRTKAIIAVHLAGWPCEMDEIMALAREHGLWVIEDCAQAHGATYKGRPVGCLGHVAAWSFCQDKIMTTGGEGGMLTTNDRSVWERAWSYKDHGKSYEAVYHRQHPPGFRWLHESFGTNWRMTEMQSAIGRVVLRKVPRWVATRRRYAQIFTEYFQQTPGLRVTIPPDYIGHAYYRYYVFVCPEMLRPDWSRDRIMIELNQKGIPCNVGSCSEVYLEKSFERAGLQPPQRLPVAKQLGETSLAFLVHPTLSEENIQEIARTVAKVMREACR